MRSRSFSSSVGRLALAARCIRDGLRRHPRRGPPGRRVRGRHVVHRARMPPGRCRVRIGWIVAVALGLVGAVWIGQGLGLIRGRASWRTTCAGRPRAPCSCVGRRDRLAGHEGGAGGLEPGRSTSASARPAVTSLPWRTSGRRSSRGSASSRGHDPGVVHAAGGRARRRGRPRRLVERAPSRRAARRSGGARPARSAACAGRRSGPRPVAPGRSGAPPRVAWSIVSVRRPGCPASSLSACCRAERASRRRAYAAGRERRRRGERGTGYHRAHRRCRA